jgi:hypothetical protein
MATNYSAFIKRISKCNTLTEIQAVDRSLDRLYNNHFFTVNEYKKLTVKIMEKQTQLTTI